jgi:hypothetical protein
MVASNIGEAMDLSMGCGGLGAVIKYAWQHGQAYFLRTWRKTFILAGM